jgi:hypothetical protein
VEPALREFYELLREIRLFMREMVKHVLDAGLYAPVTILKFTETWRYGASREPELKQEDPPRLEIHAVLGRYRRHI